MCWQCHCVTPTPRAGSVNVSHQLHGLAVSLCHTSPWAGSVSFTPTPWAGSVIVSHQHHGLVVSLCHTNTMGWQCHCVTPTPVTRKSYWSEQARLVSLSQFLYWYPHLSAWNIVCVFYQITPFLTFTFKRECYQRNNQRTVHSNIFPPSLNRQ